MQNAMCNVHEAQDNVFEIAVYVSCIGMVMKPSKHRCSTFLFICSTLTVPTNRILFTYFNPKVQPIKTKGHCHVMGLKPTDLLREGSVTLEISFHLCLSEF